MLSIKNQKYKLHFVRKMLILKATTKFYERILNNG